MLVLVSPHSLRANCKQSIPSCLAPGAEKLFPPIHRDGQGCGEEQEHHKVLGRGGNAPGSFQLQLSSSSDAAAGDHLLSPDRAVLQLYSSQQGETKHGPHAGAAHAGDISGMSRAAAPSLPSISPRGFADMWFSTCAWPENACVQL